MSSEVRARASLREGLKLFGNLLGNSHPLQGTLGASHLLCSIEVGKDLLGWPQTLPSLNLRNPVHVLNDRSGFRVGHAQFAEPVRQPRTDAQ